VCVEVIKEGPGGAEPKNVAVCSSSVVLWQQNTVWHRLKQLWGKRLKMKIIHGLLFCNNMANSFNPLKTKGRQLYLKAQSVPRCKHFPPRLFKDQTYSVFISNQSVPRCKHFPPRLLKDQTYSVFI